MFERMTHETLEKLVRRAFAYAQGQVSFGFQGGEPTLAGADFYADLLKLEKKYNASGIPVFHALQTNGLLLHSDLISVLKEGNFLLGVSLDGMKSIHDARRIDSSGQGTWDRIQQNLRLLQQEGIPFNILCVVDEPVARNAQEVFDALKGYEYLQFIPCLDPLSGAHDANSLTAKSYGEFLCTLWDNYAHILRSGGFLSIRTFDNWLQMLRGYPPEGCGLSGVCGKNLIMEADGSLYPCDFYALDEWKIGNINASSFYAIDKSDILQRFISQSVPIHSDCKACPYCFLCRGGCRRERDVSGAIGKNRLCDGLKYFFSEKLSDMTNLAKQMIKV